MLRITVRFKYGRQAAILLLGILLNLLLIGSASAVERPGEQQVSEVDAGHEQQAGERPEALAGQHLAEAVREENRGGDGGGREVADLRQALATRAGSWKTVLILNFPNNPTGYSVTKAEADALFKSVDEILKFVSDHTGLPIKSPVKRELTGWLARYQKQVSNASQGGILAG